MTLLDSMRHPIPFGDYLLLDPIDLGGMGQVWRGKMFGEQGVERLVAIKRILPEILEDRSLIKMFINEAKINAQLSHANIGRLYDFGEVNGNYYIAMEYISGKSLRDICDRFYRRKEISPVALAVFCATKMCEALDYAHRKRDARGQPLNIVHRDVSPQNVIISYEGEVKVIDFGIAKVAGLSDKTRTGILRGKLHYMSPEQIRGFTLDRRSDIFAIGICLYEMLTGERLFMDDNPFEVIERVRSAEIPLPRHFNPNIPAGLEKVVFRALAKEADDRYQYASDMIDELQRFLLAGDVIYSQRYLREFMQEAYAEEILKEEERLEKYSRIKRSQR